MAAGRVFALSPNKEFRRLVRRIIYCARAVADCVSNSLQKEAAKVKGRGENQPIVAIVERCGILRVREGKDRRIGPKRLRETRKTQLSISFRFRPRRGCIYVRRQRNGIVACFRGEFCSLAFRRSNGAI